MLVAHYLGQRVEARAALRGAPYACPVCGTRAVLKRGMWKIAHFAHKARQSCGWGHGETLEHLQAKQCLADALMAEGYRADVEVPIAPGDRSRVMDVEVKFPSHHRLAIELQHTSIPVQEIEARCKAYARAGIAQIWIGFLKTEELARLKPMARGGGYWLTRYSRRPWQRFAQTLSYGRLWFYAGGQLYFAKVRPHMLEVPETDFGGGYEYPSKRWRDLELNGPYAVAHVDWLLESRIGWRGAHYAVPPCLVASFRPVA